MTLATAVLIAALMNWFGVDVQYNTLIATLAFASSVLVTGWGAWNTMYRMRPLTDSFLTTQLVFDVLLVTSAVHVTGQRELSQFAPLYIVFNTSAALLLPIGSSLLLALFGAVLYAGDVFLLSDVTFSAAPATQIGLFILAAVAVSLITSRLQQVGASSRPLVAALAQARLEASDILSNLRTGVLTIDASGVLLYSNPAAAELLGFDLGAYSARPVLANITTVAPGLTAALQRAIDERAHTQREEARVTRAGRDFSIGVTTTSVEGGSSPGRRSITAIFQDISDQQRVDQLRRRAARLEAVAEVSASLAHEIRNPLASIRSAVEQLGQSPRATPDEKTLTRLIVRESDRLSRLLGEFLDFARARVTKLATVDLCEVARGAANLAAAHPAVADGVTVECLVPPSPVRIEGDEDLLHRAVFNLALNAVQAAPAGGRVTVEVRTTLDEPLPDGVQFEHGAVLLRVSDNGPGIDAEIRERIFQPFATTKPGGSGLGLAMAHRAIESHRGQVLVDSDAHGTRFTVLLPLAQVHPAPNGVSA